MKKNVLIVEDEMLVGMMLSGKIQEFGFTVCDVVSSGEEAISAAKVMERDGGLMDVSLGGEMDGIEAALCIKEESALLIIFSTGYCQDKKLLQRAAAI